MRSARAKAGDRLPNRTIKARPSRILPTGRSAPHPGRRAARGRRSLQTATTKARRTAVLVTRSASDGFSLLGTVLNEGCHLIHTESNVRTIAVCSRMGPSLVLVSVGVPGLSKLRTAEVVERLSTRMPVVTRDTCTCRRSQGTTRRTKYGSFVSGPVTRRGLGRGVGG